MHVKTQKFNMLKFMELLDVYIKQKKVENDDGLWVRLSTESIRQHCQPGWYPLEAWCLQFNQHIDKILLHPITTSSRLGNSTNHSSSRQHGDNFVDSEATPTSDVNHHLNTMAPEITPRKSSNQTNRSTNADDHLVETNPFRSVFKSSDECTESLTSSGKLSHLTRNPFEKLPKRSGKVIEDADDLEEYASQDECEKSGVSSISSSPNYNHGNAKHQSNIGTWTAGVMGGSSSKLQAIQKWFKSESFEGKDSPKRRGDFSELASVSVRDLVKAIGGNSNEGKANCNSSHQLSQSSSPISIPFSKWRKLV